LSTAIDQLIAARLREERVRNALTQIDLARRTSLSAERIVEVEEKGKGLSCAELWSLVKAMQVSVGAFFDGACSDRDLLHAKEHQDRARLKVEEIRALERLDPFERAAVFKFAETLAEKTIQEKGWDKPGPN